MKCAENMHIFTWWISDFNPLQSDVQGLCTHWSFPQWLVFWSGPWTGNHCESEVVQSCLTLCDPMNYSLPGSSIHRIFQARILEWAAISFSRGVFPTQGLNLGLLHCRQTLYSLSHRGIPTTVRYVAKQRMLLAEFRGRSKTRERRQRNTQKKCVN